MKYTLCLSVYIESWNHLDLKPIWNNNDRTEQVNNYPSAHPARAFKVQDGWVSRQPLLREEFSVPEKTRQFVDLVFFPALCSLSFNFSDGWNCALESVRFPAISFVCSSVGQCGTRCAISYSKAERLVQTKMMRVYLFLKRRETMETVETAQLCRICRGSLAARAARVGEGAEVPVQPRWPRELPVSGENCSLLGHLGVCLGDKMCVALEDGTGNWKS